MAETIRYAGRYRFDGPARSIAPWRSRDQLDPRMIWRRSAAAGYGLTQAAPR
jgi:hypothetical protein